MLFFDFSNPYFSNNSDKKASCFCLVVANLSLICLTEPINSGVYYKIKIIENRSSICTMQVT